MVGSERLPVDTISIRAVFALEVKTIQVATVTSFIPPSSLESIGTVLFILWVVIIVSGAE